MTDSTKLEKQLENELRYLMFEIDLYLETTYGLEFQHTHELSMVQNRFKVCMTYATKLDDHKALDVLDIVGDGLDTMAYCFAASRNILNRGRREIGEHLDGVPRQSTISVEEYKEK